VLEWAFEWFRFTIGPGKPTRGDAQTGFLRFMMDIFVYKWLLLVIGEIINRHNYLFALVAIGYSSISGTSMHHIEFSQIAYKGG